MKEFSLPLRPISAATLINLVLLFSLPTPHLQPWNLALVGSYISITLVQAGPLTIFVFKLSGSLSLFNILLRLPLQDDLSLHVVLKVFAIISNGPAL